MKDIISSINSLKKSKIKSVIDTRLKEFSVIKEMKKEKIFKELCFCIMTANCGAEKCIEIHEKIDNGFINLSNENLVKKFKELGYRFPNIRSKYIIEARSQINNLEKVIKDDEIDFNLRDWLVKNIKGLGYKEASHFLRNIGFNDYAIIDFHIIDILEKHSLIQKPKTISKKKYLEIEEILKKIALRLKLNLAELDLYLWYLETGKILK